MKALVSRYLKEMMGELSKLPGPNGTGGSLIEAVDHSREEWVRGAAHTNTVEGFFSIFKRGMTGVYQHCSERHLHRYLAEFDFRYNQRVALGIGDPQRTEEALKGIVGKRLTYRDSSLARRDG